MAAISSSDNFGEVARKTFPPFLAIFNKPSPIKDNADELKKPTLRLYIFAQASKGLRI